MRLLVQMTLWLAPAIFEAVIVVVMFVRRSYIKLPYFFTYMAYDVITSFALLSVKKHLVVYVYSYWCTEVVSWTLVLFVIYEIYANLLKEYAALRKVGATLFWVVGILLTIIALWTAFNATGSDSSRFIEAVLALERSMRIVQSGLLIILFVFSSFFGLSWKNYLFGIALGLAIFVCVELGIIAIRVYGGAAQQFLFSWLKPIAYNVAVFVWAVYWLKPWREANLATLPRTELAAWNHTLQELLHR